jgi:DNA-binding transcriptional ArsR family regulator
MPDPSPTPLPRATLLFRLLGDPTRLRLLLALAGGAEMSVGQLAEAVGHDVSTVSNHLRPLRVLGVVALRRDGRRRLYRLTSEQVRYLLGLLPAGGCDPGGGPRGTAPPGDTGRENG